jgi:hypothetical protein
MLIFKIKFVDVVTLGAGGRYFYTKKIMQKLPFFHIIVFFKSPEMIFKNP